MPGHGHEEIDGNRKPDALEAAGIAGNGRVDADDLAAQVAQRATAVAGIDGRVGLQKILKADRVVAQFKIVPPAGTDDAERDRMAEAEGAADGKHEVADLHAIAVADRRGDQIGRLDGQHADVGRFVLQHPLRMQSPAVGQIDANAVGRGVAKDVPVGEHVESALPLDDHARALLLDMPVEIVRQRPLRHVGLDIDDRRADQFRHGLEYCGLGLQQWGVLLQNPPQLGPRFGRRDRMSRFHGLEVRGAGRRKA